jgi:hypothetical protein
MAAEFPDTPEQKMVGLGCSLIGMMATRDFVAAHFIKPAHTRTTAASPWTDYRALADWGWEQNLEKMRTATTYMLQEHMDPVMHDLGLPDLDVPREDGTAEPIQWDHKRVTTHDGIEYRVSNVPSVTLHGTENATARLTILPGHWRHAGLPHGCRARLAHQHGHIWPGA